MPKKRRKKLKEVELSTFQRLKQWRTRGFVAANCAVNVVVWGALAWAFPVYALAVFFTLLCGFFFMTWLCRDLDITGDLRD